MARARLLKPGFFLNDQLAELEPLARLLFAGLWCVADREGRLGDRPARIKAGVLPYDECDVNELLGDLAPRGFIRRYKVDGEAYVQVEKFLVHQRPHTNETASLIPPPELGIPLDDHGSLACTPRQSMTETISPTVPGDPVPIAVPKTVTVPVAVAVTPAEAVSDAAATEFQELERLWFDVSGQTLNSFACEQLLSWIDDGHFNLVEAAMTKAGEANKKNWNWMRAVVQGWIDNGGRDDIEEKPTVKKAEPLPISPAQPGSESHARREWGVVLEALREQVNAAAYKTWFDGTEGAYVSKERYLYVTCKNQMTADWMENNAMVMVMAAIGQRYPDVRFLAVTA